MISCRDEMPIDIETFSDIDISKLGAGRYADSPLFDILLIAYRLPGEEEVKILDLTAGETDPKFWEYLTDPKITKSAYNANFERTCFEAYTGMPMPPDEWRCTAVLASSLGLPRSLAAVGEALGLSEDDKKMKAGKALIQYFCKPCKPTKVNGQRTRNMPHHAPERWELFKEYCKQDVHTEQVIREKLVGYAPNTKEQKLWSIDQDINGRGVRLDLDLASTIVKHDERRQELLKAEAVKLTGLANPNSLQQLRGWLAGRGVNTDSLDKATVKALLSEDIPADVKRVLQIRQDLGKTSIKKYQTMIDIACHDDRARGLMQFYGGHTGRWAGRGLQPQNLARNDMPDADLDRAHAMVKARDWEGIGLMFKSEADVLSQLVRTGFIPSEGRRFVVSDFAAIEARVLAWMASEQWRIDAFNQGRDIYCESASQMFKVPVEKHGLNGHLRQQGKIAELACIAEDELVLTDRGLVPIQEVTTDMKVWDGREWVSHDGVIFKGYREVITYEGLTATRDHLVYIEGQPVPIFFEVAATRGAHIVQAGDGGRAVRMGQDHKPGEEMERSMEQMLCADRMSGVRCDQMDKSGEPQERQEQRLSEVHTAAADTSVARQETHCCQAEMREPEGQRLPEVRSEGHQVRVRERDCCGAVSDRDLRSAGQELGAGQNRHEWQLRSGKSSLRDESREPSEQAHHCSEPIRSELLAVCGGNSPQDACQWSDQRSDHRGSSEGCGGEAKGMESHQGKVRVYDILNAGRHHRYTVSNKLVHNCGYGGGVGAIKSMDSKGAIPEEDIEGIVSAWRLASPNIVKMWRGVERAALTAVEQGGLIHKCKCSFKRVLIDKRPVLLVGLPSGRKIAYWGVKIKEGKYGPALTYEHLDQTTHKWGPVETYGGKLTENIVQSVARDCLAEKMIEVTEAGYEIVFHVHDEMIIDAPKSDTKAAEVIDRIMSAPIKWADGLPLKGDTYECDFYRKG